MEHSSLFRKITEQVASLQPLIEIAGRHRVLVEHHSGIGSYCEQEITIRMPYGSLKIVGKSLSVLAASSEQLLITGIVEQLMLSEEEISV